MKKTFETKFGLVKVKDVIVENEEGVEITLNDELLALTQGMPVHDMNKENVETLVEQIQAL